MNEPASAGRPQGPRRAEHHSSIDLTFQDLTPSQDGLGQLTAGDYLEWTDEGNLTLQTFSKGPTDVSNIDTVLLPTQVDVDTDSSSNASAHSDPGLPSPKRLRARTDAVFRRNVQSPSLSYP